MDLTDNDSIWRGLVAENDRLAQVYVPALADCGAFLGMNWQFFREVYYACRTQKAQWEHQSPFGLAITIAFDWEHNVVTISGFAEEVIMSLSAFTYFLGLIDSVYADILPLGTVVRLDLKFLPEPLQQVFTADTDTGKLTAAKVVITGRKLSLGDDTETEKQYVIDYTATLWPFGILPGTVPFMVNNVMIAEVCHRGYCDAIEEEFALTVLKATQLAHGQHSTAYMPLAEAAVYLEALGDELAGETE